MLFLLACESRNEFNHKQRDETFKQNYYRLFRLKLPHMDAVDNLFEKLNPTEIEGFRCCLIHALIEKRVFHRFRFFDKYFYVAIDGTGVYNWNESSPEEILDQAITKESHTGRKSYSFQALEAVLVSRNGMSIPLLNEWVANKGEVYDKQDCEINAFKRLSERLKRFFPRLNICILADGLYSNVVIMNICRQYGWKFITVFRDGNLPSVWKEVESLLPLTGAGGCSQRLLCDSTHMITRNYRWINNIEYKNHVINWIECVQVIAHTKSGGKKHNRFVFITNLELDDRNIISVLAAGRARWLIEDYFNTQKNRGGNLHHKFNRTNFNALKNWHNVRQLVGMINEFVEHTRESMQMMKEHTKMTLKELWKNLNSYLSMCSVGDTMVAFEQWSKQARQVRLE